ncbi:(2,3-dihydroxybenzoyl)adenylate synthase [Antrihabitans cavernicola]|uniref:AMP-binding protein n=1 Tax=Antrihabitans cavernicola TaxID=2495913 RepID=A0A5A7S264_9NOCA|nr:AMP-binding protein [Spelaeibacter cavernicola]KAA0017971.1 AMP-binding protein [Spelaeibacter cavernicola]
MTSHTAASHREGFVPFRDDIAASYRAADLWRGTTLGAILSDAATRWPTRTAVLTDGDPISYADLDVAADRLAAGLIALGIEPGDRVVMQLPNRPEFVTTLFGLLRAGAIPVMCLPAHRSAEIGHLAELSGAVGYVIADTAAGFDYRELARTVQHRVPSMRHVLVAGDPGPYLSLSDVARDRVALPDIDPTDIALLLVSGGTTGVPKLIPRTHDDYAYNARASAELCRLDSADVYLATLPAAHNFPLACPGILGTLGMGGAVCLIEDPSPESSFATIERNKVTITAVVPPLAQLWCAAVEWEDANIESLRLLQVGGAKLAESNARAVTPALNAQLQQVFGMAEGLLNYTRLNDSDELICTTQGRPLSDADEVRVVDGEGNDVPDGVEGELLTRGPYTIRGYYRAEEHNARAITADGFYRSGDLVRRLASGHLMVTGRIKDVINRGGENVSCDELEEHLLAHPAIRHAAAVGLPDDSLGEKVCAAVVLDALVDSPTLAEIKAFLTDRGLAAFKLPDSLHRATQLPVTAVGKIDKRALAEQIAH